MELNIEWNEGSKKVDVAEIESDVYKEIGQILPTLDVPNTIYVDCRLGYAEFQVAKRGTFIKNGVKKPSMYVTEIYNSITNLSCSTYDEAYLTCINPESNNYKFYHLKPSLSGIGATYGRIGAQKGEMFGEKDLEIPYPTYMYWIRYYEKLSKGYIDQSDIYLDNSSKIRKSLKPIDVSHKTSDLSMNLFRDLKSCARQYVATHCISTNVTRGQVKASKKYYRELCQRKTLNGFNKKLMELLSVCPRKARYVTELLAISKDDFTKILQREENLVNAMEALILDDSIINAEDSFEALGIRVFEATDEQKKEVLNHLDGTLRQKVDTIYRVICRKHKNRFDKYLKENGITKVKQFWHGSRNENWFSIITNGLLLNPDAIITGKMFGNGIYFAPSSEKSWKYTSYRGSYWAKGNDDVAYMGLYATAYGTPENVYSSYKYTQDYLDRINKNCVHAHAGTQLLNDEIIFYREDALCLNYIVKFK